MRRAAALLAACALAAAGCGDSNEGDARDLLERGFATDVDTGVVKVEAEVELEGIEQLDEPLRLELEGPVRAAPDPTQLPDLDMEFHASGAGQSFDGRVVMTAENAWIEFGGATYEVGEELWARARAALEEQNQSEPQSFEQAGVDPLDWIDGAETEGEEEVAGAQTTHVTGRLDVKRMLSDFNKLAAESGESLPQAALDQVADYVDDVQFDAWVGGDDIWRRISAESEFEVPEEERGEAFGLEGGRVALTVELAQPNEPVEIEGLPGGRSIDELLRRFGVPPELFLGPGFTQPEPG